MRARVEPQDGRELDRLITALLNVTGAVHRLITSVEDRPDLDGVEVIGLAAERLRACLTLLAEHHSDEELALVTQALAGVTVFVAQRLDLGDSFREP
jgi:hypothetical protein